MTPTCKLCGNPHDSTDADWPYCRDCYYTGKAWEDARADELASIRKLLPDATVGVEHTGGGCFWVAARWEGDPKYYVMTDGDAGIPTGEDGWGYVGRHDDTETPDGLALDNDDYDGTILVHREPPGRLPAELCTAEILLDRSRRSGTGREILVHLNVTAAAGAEPTPDQIADLIVRELGRLAGDRRDPVAGGILAVECGLAEEV